MRYNPNDNSNSIDDDFNYFIGRMFREKRIEKRYSLENVSKKLKKPVTKQMLHKYEANISHMKRETFIDLCIILDINPRVILEQCFRYLLYNTTYNTKWEIKDALYNSFIENEKKEIKITHDK